MPKILIVSTLGGSIQTGEIDDGAVTFVKLASNAQIHRKQFADATTRQKTGDVNWSDSGTAFTFTAPVDAMILGGIFKITLRTSASTGQVNLEFDGTNLGKKYLAVARQNDGEFVSGYYVAAEELTFSTTDANNRTFVIAVPPLAIEDASTTITLRIKVGDAGETATLLNVTLDLIYAGGFTED